MPGSTTTHIHLLSPATAASRSFRLRPVLALPRSSSPTPRKNHLRPKILKIIAKPFPTTPLPEIVPTSTLPLPPHVEVLEPEKEVESFAVSESVGPPAEYVDSVRRFSLKSVLKFGGYLLGVLLFQAAAAVVVLGVARSVKEEQSSYGGGGGGGDEVCLMSDEEVERRVKEIREMARAARDREREIERREKGDESGRDRVIEKEIKARLNKLEKRLDEDKREAGQAGGALVGLLPDEDEDDGEDFKVGGTGSRIERFLFKKKMKFSSTLSGSSSEAKGFSGLSGENVSDPGVDIMRNDADALQDASKMNSTIVVEKKLNQPISEGNQYPKDATKSSQHITSKDDSINGMKVRDSTGREDASDARKELADAPTDLWWFKLPYVLVILMRRGPQQDETGLFVLRLNSTAGDEQGAACTLAFEDRSDANNFCNLLESYFQNVDHFSADIVPLSTKELQESVKSQSEKVLVVKKGQIKLYAGQPFTDVESALRSLL